AGNGARERRRRPLAGDVPSRVQGVPRLAGGGGRAGVAVYDRDESGAESLPGPIAAAPGVRGGRAGGGGGWGRGGGRAGGGGPGGRAGCWATRPGRGSSG